MHIIHSLLWNVISKHDNYVHGLLNQSTVACRVYVLWFKSIRIAFKRPFHCKTTMIFLQCSLSLLHMCLGVLIVRAHSRGLEGARKRFFTYQKLREGDCGSG